MQDSLYICRRRFGAGARKARAERGHNSYSGSAELFTHHTAALMPHLKLNADFGESFGPWRMGADEQLVRYLDMANIACGGHAADPETMWASLALARQHGVSCGAHPGYADKLGFGRRHIAMSAKAISALVAAQVGALAGLADLVGVKLEHVKPHGALNNRACRDAECALAIVVALRACLPMASLLAPAGSVLARVGREQGLLVLEEVFADRNYADDGSLLSREHPQALIADPAACREHLRAMVAARAIISINGKRIAANIDSVCVHGDAAGAAERARACREYLDEC